MRGGGERGVDAPQPPATEAPEVRERAISPPPDVAVARNGLTERRRAGGGKGDRADIAVDVDVKSFLEEARGCGDAVVDGGIEVHECERSAERGAVRGVPVAADVDVADERIGDRLQGRLQRGEVFRSDVDAAFARVDGECDALVGRSAGIVRIVGPAAFHVEDVAERGLEVRVSFGRLTGRGRRAIAEHEIAIERSDGDGIRLIAAEQDDVSVGDADEKADVAEHWIAAAAENGDGAGGGRGARNAPLLVRSRAQRACAGDAGALEAGANEGSAPRRLIGLVWMSELVEHRDDALVVRRPGTLGLAKLAPGLGHPGWLLH